MQCVRLTTYILKILFVGFIMGAAEGLKRIADMRIAHLCLNTSVYSHIVTIYYQIYIALLRRNIHE